MCECLLVVLILLTVCFCACLACLLLVAHPLRRLPVVVRAFVNMSNARPQQDRPVCAIMYSTQFTETMDRLRQVLHDNHISAEALEVTKQAIELNPANYTAWYFRRLCILQLQADLAQELAFVAQCARESPKNYQLW
jgi:hypothetical protein